MCGVDVMVDVKAFDVGLKRKQGSMIHPLGLVQMFSYLRACCILSLLNGLCLFFFIGFGSGGSVSM